MVPPEPGGGGDTIHDAIDALAGGQDLSQAEAAAVLEEVMSGRASEIQIAAFLIALRTKGETVEEIAGLAQAMRSFATGVQASRDDLLDTAGTGGGQRTFNVSTTAALIAAGAGCAVAKHGNRSATGLSGSADLLEALGARIDLTPVAVARCIEEVGFGFMFAPAHHQATRFVVPVRRDLAVRTIFNFLGPLTNPAGARRQLIGVADPAYLDVVAGALARLGVDRALVVSSADGLDEMSTSGETHVVEVNGSEISSYQLLPEEVGVSRCEDRDFEHDCAGGTPEQNAAVTTAILQDEAAEAGRPASAELALINAGAAVYAAEQAASIADGVDAARAALADGSAAAALDRYVRASVARAPTEAPL